jgi:hypothetical protein
MSGGFYFNNLSTRHHSKYTNTHTNTSAPIHSPFLSFSFSLTPTHTHTLSLSLHKLHKYSFMNMASVCTTAEEPLIHNHKIDGLNPAQGTARDSLVLGVRQ